jgi:hypothetical protein
MQHQSRQPFIISVHEVFKKLSEPYHVLRVPKHICHFQRFVRVNYVSEGPVSDFRGRAPIFYLLQGFLAAPYRLFFA